MHANPSYVRMVGSYITCEGRTGFSLVLRDGESYTDRTDSDCDVSRAGTVSTQQNLGVLSHTVNARNGFDRIVLKEGGEKET